MARIIKFRGRVILTNDHYCGGEIVYGTLVIYNEQFGGSTHWIIPPDDYRGYPIDPDSVAQFTNCFDVNREEIYDGDVVKLQDSYGRIYKPTKVFWCYEQSCWAVRWENGLADSLGAACTLPQGLILVKEESE